MRRVRISCVAALDDTVSTDPSQRYFRVRRCVATDPRARPNVVSIARATLVPLCAANLLFRPRCESTRPNLTAHAVLPAVEVRALLPPQRHGSPPDSSDCKRNTCAFQPLLSLQRGSSLGRRAFMVWFISSPYIDFSCVRRPLSLCC